jgi:tetratricopeptide (TPR) repeat protein
MRLARGLGRIPSPLPLLLALLLVCAPVRAQPSDADQRQAQALFDQGRILMDQGRFGEACPLFAESQKLDPGGGTLLNLAFCHEKQGRVATAYVEYSSALSLALRDGRADRKQIADERLRALEGKLPRARIQLPHNVAPEALTLELDGTTLQSRGLVTPLPVDAGVHTLVVRSPGFQSRQLRFEAFEGSDTQVAIADLEREHVSNAPTADRGEAPHYARRLSTASWIAGGIGVAAIGAAVVTGVLALQANGSADGAIAQADCSPDRGFCRDRGLLDDARADRDRARTFAWVNTGTLVVGVAALAIAVLLPRHRVPVADK